jgi:adenine-specific DNA-methyltransferase
MKNLLDELVETLSLDDRLKSEGRLLKNKVIELAMNLDAKILELLIKNQKLKLHFFEEVANILIFDKVKFQKFVSNKAFLPDSYTSFKNKIGLTANGTFITDSDEVVLAWPYKDCLLEGGQDIEDAKRDEIFWNETLASDQIDQLLSPKALTKFKKFEASGTRDVTQADIATWPSLIIKGNNLLALHSLRNKYAGKVKLIYIDPPYNPDSKANTFCYNNKFNRSTWLTFIKNRIEVAKDFLTDDGVMIVAIDEQEQAHLGVLLKEMFPAHEVHCITIVHNPRGVQGTNFSYTHEYAFFVIPEKKKSIGNRKIEEADISWRNLRDNGGESLRSDARNCFYGIIVENGSVVGFTDVVPNEVNPEGQTVNLNGQNIVYPIDPEGIERKWRYARQSVPEIQHLLRAKKGKNGLEIEIGKDFGSYRTVWQDPRYDANEYGTKILKSLVPDSQFLFPKSLWNVYDCLYAVIGDDKNATVMDFFGGSGTTAHAVLELNRRDGGNRKFILAEQMHYVESVTVPRIHQVVKNNGAGDFIYFELNKSNQSFLEAILEANSTSELQEIFIKMEEEAFLSYKVDSSKLKEISKGLEQLSLDDQKAILIDLLDKNNLYIPYSEIQDKTYAIDETERLLNDYFYRGI